MKPIIGLLTCGLLLINSSIYPQKITWEKQGQLPKAIFGGIAVNFDSCIYLIGGQTGNRTGRLNTTFEFNLENKTWTEKTKMQTEKLGFVATRANNKIYAIRKEMNEEYDPKANCWITKKPIPEDNVHLTGNSINNKIYVINKSNWIYNPHMDSWEKFAAMNNQVCGMSVVLDGKLCIIGGFTGGRGHEKSISNFEFYDPLTNKWERKADLPMPIFACAPVAVNGKVIIIGGQTVTPENEQFTDDVYMYNPSKDTWTQLNDFLYPVSWAAATVHKNVIYVFGGANDKYEPYATVWRGTLEEKSSDD